MPGRRFHSGAGQRAADAAGLHKANRLHAGPPGARQQNRNLIAGEEYERKRAAEHVRRKEVNVEKDSTEKLVMRYVKDCYEEYLRLVQAERETAEAIRLAVFSPAMPSTTFFLGAS